MQRKISKDTPLAEVTFRKYEKPTALSKRDLVRKICLSIGLLQPGDSRDVIVDVFYTLLTSKEPLTSTEIEKKVIEIRKEQSLPLHGIAPSNIRRQILRLKDMLLLERVGNYYRLNENSYLTDIFVDKLEKYLLESIMSRIKEYMKEADKVFELKNV